MGQAADAKPDVPNAEMINGWITQLGDSSFSVREDATRSLWRAGLVARAALEQAAKSDDREVAYRANFILGRFRLGIFPDTPRETVSLIKHYHRGDYNVKQSVLSQLHDRKQYQTMLALLRTETDERVRRQLAQKFISASSGAMRQLILDGEFARAEQLLEWGATFDSYGTQLRTYSAYHLLRGSLDEKISQLQRDAADNGPKDTLRKLACLLRARGDFRDARLLAERTGDTNLIADLHYRLEDWQALSKDMIPGDVGVENLGFSAAFHALAGNTELRRKAIEDLKQLAKDKPERAWMCGEALMINDEWQAAVDAHREKSPVSAFRMLCEQSRFLEAFELLGIDEPPTKAPQWFEERAGQFEPDSKEMASHFQLGLQVARALYRVNERDESLRLLDAMMKSYLDEKGTRLRSLVKLELSLGLKERAFDHATTQLAEAGQNSSMLGTLFRTHLTEAKAWWPYFALATLGENGQTTLERLVELLNPSAGKLPCEKMDELARACEQQAPADPAGRVDAIKGIAEVCLIHDHHDLARHYFMMALDQPSPAAAMMRIADTYAQQERWSDAADWYSKAWQQEEKDPVALYLQGHALQQAGQSGEGDKLVALATLLPLGDIAERQKLANGLVQRGLRDQAVEQWELMLRLGPMDSWEGSQAWAVRDAARYVCYHSADVGQIRSASLRRRRVFYLLKTNTAFIDIEYYARTMHQIHKALAGGLLEQGKTDEAIREIWLAHKARPDEVDVALDLTEQLNAAGRSEVADELFKSIYGTYDRVIRDFPNSAHHHNNLAWLCARSERQLDDALRHARLAVELRPNYAAYVDTLAEAHFRLGDREQAIKFSRRAVELEPDDETLKQQLERFQKQ